MDITSVTTTTATTAAAASGSASETTSTAFATALEEASAASTDTTTETDATASTTSSAEGKADAVSGRLGIDYKALGVPYRVVYFDENGEQLTTSPFNAARILELTEKFGIDLNDLTGLGEQLDAAGVGYRPYELYPGTGSDHGIDFADLIDNGLGTAYDWREDANVALKGDSGQKSLTAAQELAERLGVERHATVTTGGGIDSSQFAVQSADGSPLSAVAFNGSVAAWYATHDEAAQAAAGFGGQVLDLADTTTATSANTATTASTNITV